MTAPSAIAAAPVALDDIAGMRDDYRREMGCQIVHDSWHARGFLRHYVLTVAGRVAGYGAVGGAPGPDVTFGPLSAADRESAFAHTVVPVGDWGLKAAGELVATGGVLTHYNPPFGDLHMEVAPAWRGRGLGSYLVQELKRACYGMGRVPAARCHVTNVGSRRALERAGMFPCARILRGELGNPSVGG